MRFVLANPSDPSRLNEFNDWYDTYSAALTGPGYLANDIHFENPDASGGNTNPRYATIDDIVAPDPATAWPDTEHSPAYPTQLLATRAPSWSPSPARLLRPHRLPAPAGPARPAHRHSRHPLQRRRRHRTPAPGGPDPANWLVLLRRPIPDHRRIPRASRMARGIRDRRPRPLHTYLRATSYTLPASQIQPQLSESFRLAGARVFGTGDSLNTRERQLCVTIAGQKPSRRATQRHPASEPVIRTWIPGRSPSSSTGCPPPTHVNRGREVQTTASSPRGTFSQAELTDDVIEDVGEHAAEQFHATVNGAHDQVGEVGAPGTACGLRASGARRGRHSSELERASRPLPAPGIGSWRTGFRRNPVFRSALGWFG